MNGEPPYDFIEGDPDRYGKWCTLDFQRTKIRETYGMNNSISFPKEERFAGRPTERVSGSYEAMKARGAHFGFHSGKFGPITAMILSTGDRPPNHSELEGKNLKFHYC